MKGHVRIYFEHFGYGEQSFIPCEICSDKAVDIHHILFKSLGGKDEISNLMALCRECHDDAHAHRYKRKMLFNVHKRKVDEHRTI